MNNFIEISPTELKENTFKLIGTDWMLIAAEDNNKVNAMTASWGGLGVMWNKNVAYIVIRPQRYTKEFIDNSNTFSLGFFDDSFKNTLKYMGTVTGRDEDKISKSNLSVAHDSDTPYFNEANTVILCKKLFAQPFNPNCFLDKSLVEKNYSNGDYHTMYIGEITKVLIKK